MPATGPELNPGDPVPGTKYRVVKQLGAGGMGIVYQVVKPPQIQGVLKLMSTELAKLEDSRQRFLDEVRILAQLDHPNIVRVFDYDTLDDGTPFYVMELLHGRTVRDVLATMGTVPPRVAFEVTRQLLEALHCAHTHDVPVVHRDIKPENIFLHAPRHGEPVVKLIDFGVVALGDRKHDGSFVGTWKYAAPEQIRGEAATPETDIYAVGLVLYEMLAGVGPFDHLDSGSLVSQAHLREVPPPVTNFAPWVPSSIVSLLAQALAKDPRQRPRDAYAFAERLFELEWADDGKDPADRTTEGPLSHILSTVGGRPAGEGAPAPVPAVPPVREEPVADAPRARAPGFAGAPGLPVVGGVPASARHLGPTLKGVGGPPDGTNPDEDELLDGLAVRPDIEPRSRKTPSPNPARVEASAPEPIRNGRRTSGPGDHLGEAPTREAPPSEPGLVATPNAGARRREERPQARAGKGTSASSGKGAARLDRDTFASQESEALETRRSAGRWAVPLLLTVAVIMGVLAFTTLRGHPAEPSNARAEGPSAGAGPLTMGALDAKTAARANGRGDARETPEAHSTPPSPAAEASAATSTPLASASTLSPRKPGHGARPSGRPMPLAQPGAASDEATSTTAMPKASGTKPKDDSFIRGL